ncbi:class I SAM-dependent methyltransferase [Methylobacterium sp. J-090]|uniref:class I SAM-dependent methyltransferase n=1 Tax=Methylobacterium sp. J-090 TaxID=2836666 RepID=UPI001FB9D480|nr:class I SAM-dependent methyltransferase [Methylobacterium sp. J-090]MCJ2080703.1 class I SAM-dependent methyltransferase [Methylobacterium sp. J-090]
MTKYSFDGGYDDGYAAVPCLWGKEPGLLVKRFLSQRSLSTDFRVLDLGCGEGKNSAAFAKRGVDVTAVDCSSKAISNGQSAFPDLSIQWINADALDFDIESDSFDLIIAYGLLHCLPHIGGVTSLLKRIKRGTKLNGYNIMCAFNSRSQDLSAHPGFNPILISHDWYVSQYSNWDVELATDMDLHESHPHNGILHHHSLTRIIARFA